MKQSQEQSLPKPTVELVRSAGDRFGDENEVTEKALTELVQKFPRNSEESHVLLKVAAINQLYTTQIYAVRIVAAHIIEINAKFNVDALLDAESFGLVDQIAQVRVADKQRNNLSFASKYCSWHRPESYPIYDSYAERCLWEYRKQFGLSFVRKQLWEYPSFVDAVKEFQERFELQRLSFKEIDKFLYLKGADLVEAQVKARAAAILSETALEIGAEGGSITLLRDNETLDSR